MNSDRRTPQTIQDDKSVMSHQEIRDPLEHIDLFKAVTDSTRDAIIMIDNRGCISFWNPAAEQILGYTTEEIVGKNLHEVIAPKRYHQAHRDAFATFQTTGKGYAIDKTLELEACHKDGREIAIELSLSSIRVQNSYHAIGIVRDVTDRKKAEEELRKSEERFKALHNASFGGIAIHENGVILDCNYGLSEITGYVADELVGLDGLLLIAPQAREMVRANIQAGVEKPYEAVGLRKDGSEYPVRIEGRNIPYKDRIVRVVEFRDITEQVRMREEQQLLQKQLLQSQKVESIGRLAGGVAHDLNNLLSPILGYSELLLNSLDLQDSHRKQLGIIFDAATRSRDLIRQLLAFSRKQTLIKKPVDLNRVIQNIQQLLRRILPEYIVIEPDFSPEACTVMADVNQIEQVLVNLSVNAADAMPEGGTITITTSLVRHTPVDTATSIPDSKGEYVRMSIRDTGKGISEEILPQIFEPFFSTKGEYGTGLGLSTVYGIVKQHDGNIEVTSTPGEGSCFTLYFPFCSKPSVDPCETERNHDTGLYKGSETILVVEDNEHVRQLTQTLLRLQGYRVVTAKDGPDAIDKALHHKGKIDLLLTDVVLPEMNGRLVSEQLTAQTPDLKTLYMSGYTAEIINPDALQDDNLNFIQKPFTKTALIEKVRSLLEA